jgi:hypothetical protein
MFSPINLKIINSIYQGFPLTKIQLESGNDIFYPNKNYFSLIHKKGYKVFDIQKIKVVK